MPAEDGPQNGNILDNGNVELQGIYIELGDDDVGGLHHNQDKACHGGGHHVDGQAHNNHIALHGHAEEGENQAVEQGRQQAHQQREGKITGEIVGQHGEQGAIEHHALQRDIQNVCLVGKQSAQHRQNDGGAVINAVIENTDHQLHVLLSFPFFPFSLSNRWNRPSINLTARNRTISA